MTHLEETLKLYRNDSEVSDAWFGRMIVDAISRDHDNSKHSVKVAPQRVPYLLTTAEFDALVAEIDRNV